MRAVSTLRCVKNTEDEIFSGKYLWKTHSATVHSAATRFHISHMQSSSNPALKTPRFHPMMALTQGPGSCHLILVQM